ncbi:MAG TPA: 3-deoxy-D-manno-octulosonate 8-phosphate phosphatase [Burkholderiales bacterium]|nr:3-deoxy-D-manno-octulosonate 8-phosphate phosphatase [Burkholderiales bacterium]
MLPVLDAAARAKPLRFMAFDVDGVLTDGSLYLSDSGEELKVFNTLDGQGLKFLQEDGIELALITARNSKVVAHRAANLGITRLHQGIEDKLACFDRIRSELGLQWAECGYMGDDLPDLRILCRCGFSAAPANAAEALHSRVHYLSKSRGGQGAVRDVVDHILRSRGTLDKTIARYLE